MIINESAENYLETILVLSGQLPVVRSYDVPQRLLGFKKPSVSVAMKTRGGPYYSFTGRLYYTHPLGKRNSGAYIRTTYPPYFWLEYLGVDSKTAADDACRIEHVISVESFDAIKNILSDSFYF